MVSVRSTVHSARGPWVPFLPFPREDATGLREDSRQEGELWFAPPFGPPPSFPGVGVSGPGKGRVSGPAREPVG